MGTRFAWTPAIVLMAALGLAPRAQAVERKGFIFGVGLGGGAIECDACDTLGSVEGGGHIGYMVGPRVAVLADSWLLSHEEDYGPDIRLAGSDYSNQPSYGGDQDSEVLAYTLIGAAQVWPIERLWLRAGAGIGQTDVRLGRVTTAGDVHFAWGLGAGVELLHRTHFVLDLSGRFSSIDARGGEQRWAIQVGANWY